eukprot:CAMPEP_0201545966 /NCGR_PEP_ID=MMETSP0173_2-20130828/2362_1 /ASSEMBLY_ACC=CAM_ASM_000268 /TAXON_ID=218659 /ORGANISM="Vexillifera sp., Strain DIVA3 564/2" /LENGTH=383 /DNA_ID=CAMNT_0047954521 /DNA_START=51 /DNA_END=1202 /DNA_ORIENTATION=-
MASARPTVQVYSSSGEVTGETTLPSVFLAPIRSDVVQFVHSNMNKNKRQAYAVSSVAGEQTSAVSWGTGRAVSRIPRVKGSGTHRAGQAAFGNMCRGGRMYNPNKVWRRWHRKINTNQRRFAVSSALAATAVPALVMARGHRVDNIPEIPLVVADSEFANISKTKDAVAKLKNLNAYNDVERVKDSRHIRCGKGKMRNRRYKQSRGPLIIYNQQTTLTKAFRNIPGVDLCHVDRMNLLSLAPGGHLGRFVIWTEGAFNRLDTLFGSHDEPSALKKNFTLPRAVMANPDLDRLLRSEEIQAVLRAPRKNTKVPKKRNPLKRGDVMQALNPYKNQQRGIAQQQRKARSKARIAKLRAKKQAAKARHADFVATVIAPVRTGSATGK